MYKNIIRIITFESIWDGVYMGHGFRYAESFIYIRSEWFDEGDNKFKKIGYKGFYLYLNFFRFLVKGQKEEYTFYTSIDCLRKCTGYRAKEIFELIRLLHKEKIIKVNNDWNSWFEDYRIGGKLRINNLIIIESVSKPMLNWEDGRPVPVNDLEKNKYITIDLRLMQLYEDLGFNERYCAVFALINKMSNNIERKMYMKINTMSKILGFSDKTISNIIEKLNENYLLYSELRDNYKKGKRYEHKILNNIDRWDEFKRSYKVYIDKKSKGC